MGQLGFSLECRWGETLLSSILVLMKPRKDMNSVSCQSDSSEIMLKGGVKDHLISNEIVNISGKEKMLKTSIFCFSFSGFTL